MKVMLEFMQEFCHAFSTPRKGAADLIESPQGPGGAPPPPVLYIGVLRQTFIDGLVFSIPDGSRTHFWSSGAHLFPNQKRPDA